MVLSEQEKKLVDELQKLRPDLVVVPRRASAIMALRGSQADPVFEVLGDGRPVDVANEYFNFSEVPKNPQWDVDLKDYLREDRREYVLVAAIWEGCIRGLEEWDRRRLAVNSEKDREFVDGWDKPFHFDLVTHPVPRGL